MPLNAIPPTTTVANLHTKLAASEGKRHIDVGFWGGVIPDNAADLQPLAKEGVKGFKAFLCESGVDEFPGINEQQILAAMKELDVRLFPLLLDSVALEPRLTPSPLARRPPSRSSSSTPSSITRRRSNTVTGTPTLPPTRPSSTRARRRSRSRPSTSSSAAPPSSPRSAPTSSTFRPHRPSLRSAARATTSSSR